MKRLLLASAAAISLALVPPAFGQITEELPATTPFVQPAPTPDVTTEENAAVQAQAPQIEDAAEAETQAEATPTAEPPSVAAQTNLAGEGQASPGEPGATSTAQVMAQTETPAATADQTATSQAPAPTGLAEPLAQSGSADAPAFASASAVCQPRTTSVHFGARGSTLSRENQNAIEHAVDSASVCDIQQITIADSATGSVSQRRAQAVRATLLRQGVPEERIAIAEQASADAQASATGRLDVRMQLAGVTNVAELAPTATSGPNAAASATTVIAEATPQTTLRAPRATTAPSPIPAPVAPEATSPSPEPVAPEATPTPQDAPLAEEAPTSPNN
jgi:outer membrane protein OmpA-like peptidoglycan-associated protein